ncbi:MAG TPA: hypothetical protein VE641_10895 [Chthoniobacterales bacterium]|nr:hypothetical protein [Chthoniobacterales bacterium]
MTRSSMNLFDNLPGRTKEEVFSELLFPSGIATPKAVKRIL